MTVLLITHDRLLAKAYGAYLSHAGNDVATYTNARAGFIYGNKAVPDCILLDARIPGMNGLEALKWLRGDPDLVKIPLILLIDRTLSAAIIEACVFWGASLCLRKDRLRLPALRKHIESLVLAKQLPQASKTATLLTTH